MKLGINSYTFMWAIGFQGANPEYPARAAQPEHPLDALGLLEQARALGVSLVQTGPNLPFETLSAKEQDEFIGQAQEWGISLELGTRGLDFDHLRKSVMLAKRMGAVLIRTLPEIGGTYAADARKIPTAVRALLPLFEGEGMRLALENGRTPSADLRAALDEINSPSIGIVLDMVNSLAVPEGWKEVTRNLAPHTMCLHYKDFTIRRAWHMMGFICEGAPACTGMLDTPWLLEQLQVSPHDFNVIIELWPPEQPSLEETIRLEALWAEESVRNLRRYIVE